MPKRSIAQLLLIINIFLICGLAGFSAYELLTHHQKGNCTSSVTSTYPQFALPVILLGLLVVFISGRWIITQPKRIMRATLIITLLSILVYISALAAILADNLCIPF